ncbi:Spermatogenesis-associated serine-rich protein 1 [Lemmus lemmus]
MGQKSSSSSSSSSSTPSSHSSQVSLPGFQREKYPEELSLLKSQTKDGQRPEWTFYPRFSSNIHTYHVGKQCYFSGVFRGNRRSEAERTLDKSLGKKKYDIDPRNGIPKLTPGDNSYMFPEQSKEFFKAGATLPPVNFSLVPYEKKFDTFIPLEPLPQIPNLPFWEKEKANNLKNEIKEVQELDDWQAPPPFLHSIFLSGRFKKFQKKYKIWSSEEQSFGGLYMELRDGRAVPGVGMSSAPRVLWQRSSPSIEHCMCWLTAVGFVREHTL